jgi:hypothetical protein
VLAACDELELSDSDSAGQLRADEQPVKPAPELLGLPLLAQTDFEAGRLVTWEPSDPDAWKIAGWHRLDVLSLLVLRSNRSLRLCAH